ncbi:hypothetical protein IAQ61_006815 [Plenodomus lingam]|uniref:Predicted protein n=1 Tax=Leptosphaeria maculans (strain JN3 / isolate v23.1.3 / race Av1-4-5-6-7-8) TaxID=985895 RepID=E5ACM7_LEPMJ|nr:predicted protein [Plenodomus lingam JN3]KAH9869606.1 hypothetical protein IAQ61_006815 [Plenodomus lingam]CBY02229.1 predicted protein [Plenodomus lingam JN3]
MRISLAAILFIAVGSACAERLGKSPEWHAINCGPDDSLQRVGGACTTMADCCTCESETNANGFLSCVNNRCAVIEHHDMCGPVPLS